MVFELPVPRLAVQPLVKDIEPEQFAAQRVPERAFTKGALPVVENHAAASS
jgi:hypothetical protein